MEQRLARRIRRQRERLRWFESLTVSWDTHYRHCALAYRKQLQELGIKPVEIWSATYKRPSKLNQE